MFVAAVSKSRIEEKWRLVWMNCDEWKVNINIMQLGSMLGSTFISKMCWLKKYGESFRKKCCHIFCDISNSWQLDGLQYAAIRKKNETSSSLSLSLFPYFDRCGSALVAAYLANLMQNKVNQYDDKQPN